MEEPHQRLQKARKEAGHETPADAAITFGWRLPTYWAHENGSRGLTRIRGQVYADAFKVEYEWLMTGKGPMRKGRDELDRVIARLDASQRPRVARLIAEFILGDDPATLATASPAFPPSRVRSSNSR